MRNSAIEIRPFVGAVGAEIRNIDLSLLLGDDVETVRPTLFDRGVVFFRDQQLTPEQHVAVAERFGPIDINRFFKHAAGYPMIAEVRKGPEQKSNIGGGWHTDHSYDQAPALGSMLYAREVPPSGGDTLFASMYAAYDALSDGLKHTLEGSARSIPAATCSATIIGARWTTTCKGRWETPSWRRRTRCIP
jgi:taurine dioxygenase